MTAILWQDGFDLYAATSDLAMNYTSPNKGVISTTGGRFGGGCYSTAGGQPTANYPLPSTTAEVWVSYAINFYAVTSGDFIIATFGSAAVTNGGIEGCVTYNPTTGTFKAWRGYLQTLLGSVTKVVSSGWHWVDFHFKMDGSAGIVEIWLDDFQILSLTAQNTIQNSGQTVLTTISWGDTFAGNSGEISIDDLFVTDAGFGRIGDARIETIVPNSDATPNNGTPSSGSNHYACVNEAQYNTSNYITMPNTSGDKEVYGVGSIASTPAVVYNVKVYMVSEKTDAGSFVLEPLVVSSGTESDGSATQLLTSSWGTQEANFPLNPHTSAAWTYSQVNAMDIGYKVP